MIEWVDFSKNVLLPNTLLFGNILDKQRKRRLSGCSLLLPGRTGSIYIAMVNKPGSEASIVRFVSRRTLSIARFSLNCLRKCFSTRLSSIRKKSITLACIDILIFVQLLNVSKLYDVCECNGPERDLKLYLLFGLYSVTSKVLIFLRPIKLLMLRKKLPTPLPLSGSLAVSKVAYCH